MTVWFDSTCLVLCMCMLVPASGWPKRLKRAPFICTADVFDGGKTSSGQFLHTKFYRLSRGLHCASVHVGTMHTEWCKIPHNITMIQWQNKSKMKKWGASKLTSKGTISTNTAMLGLLAKMGHKFYILLEKKCTHAPTMIKCCDFVGDRQQWFPGAFFCHGCDMWGQRDVSNKRLYWERRVYCCVATHSSYECWQCQDWTSEQSIDRGE